jgi:hypothetical protein
MMGLYWQRSYATNTRLMGVVVIKTYLEDRFGEQYILFSHLDYETSGYDGVTLAAVEDDRWISDQIYGGLGGELVEIMPSEAKYLIGKALELGMESIEEDDLPWLGYYDFADDLNPEGVANLYNKICVKFRSGYECIHYYMMRLVGDDIETATWIFNKTPRVRFERDSTLIRCKVEKANDNWIASALVLINDVYTVQRFKFTLADKQIVSCEFIDSMSVSDVEAALQLRQSECIALVDVRGIEDVFDRLDMRLTHKMMGEYENGALFTVFYPHNDHVNQEIYYLSNDVDFYCYLTRQDQLLVVCRDFITLHDKMNLVKKALSGYNVEILGEIEFDHQILYDFIQSGYENFIDYIEEELQQW